MDGWAESARPFCCLRPVETSVAVQEKEPPLGEFALLVDQDQKLVVSDAAELSERDAAGEKKLQIDGVHEVVDALLRGEFFSAQGLEKHGGLYGVGAAETGHADHRHVVEAGSGEDGQFALRPDDGGGGGRRARSVVPAAARMRTPVIILSPRARLRPCRARGHKTAPPELLPSRPPGRGGA